MIKTCFRASACQPLSKRRLRRSSAVREHHRVRLWARSRPTSSRTDNETRIGNWWRQLSSGNGNESLNSCSNKQSPNCQKEQKAHSVNLSFFYLTCHILRLRQVPLWVRYTKETDSLAHFFKSTSVFYKNRLRRVTL